MTSGGVEGKQKQQSISECIVARASLSLSPTSAPSIGTPSEMSHVPVSTITAHTFRFRGLKGHGLNMWFRQNAQQNCDILDFCTCLGI